MNEVLDDCNNALLKIVVTVYDMGANNAKDLKLLGATKSKQFFRYNQEIATIYDLSTL